MKYLKKQNWKREDEELERNDLRVRMKCENKVSDIKRRWARLEDEGIRLQME